MSNTPDRQLRVLPEPLDSGLPPLLGSCLIPECNHVLAFVNCEVTYLSFHILTMYDSYTPVYTSIRGIWSQLACLPGHTFSHSSFRTAHRSAKGSGEMAQISSCRRAQFSSQHPFGGSQLSISSSRGCDTLYWCLQVLHAHGICRQSTSPPP